MEKNKQTTDVGSMIGIIIVLILLIVGAFYIVGQRMEKQKEFKALLQQGEMATTTETPSDDVASMKNDVNSINIDNLGSEINNL